ncbi:MAG: SbcC/MukB-like Walker B domain-containing protein, partial [Planctomycetota bacterium]
EKVSRIAADGLSGEDQQLAGRAIQLPEDLRPQRIVDEEKNYNKRLENSERKHADRVNDQLQKLVRSMNAAQREDTGELSDIGTEIDDVPLYLQRLKTLRTEALPDKQKRFLKYLNHSSDHGVRGLLARIDEEVDAIENRIQQLNRTLLKVDFRNGKYLQLQPQRTSDQSVRELDTAQRTVRSAMMKDDEGESHYLALRTLVGLLRDAGNNRRTVGSRALLDPRYRLKFFVVEIDRKTGRSSPPRTGSQSGSGGEKELMASHILTASLSYALCPDEATHPLYASVVLDEAFSKSSPSAAARIIEALRIFGLHPIFVTPNKEIGLLKRHTRKVICVQRRGSQSSVASIRWEALADIAKTADVAKTADRQ